MELATMKICPDTKCPFLKLMRMGGFTLIELLVVVAIVTVLIGILVPSLSAARTLAKQTRELASGQQLMVAYSVYSGDNKSELLPGYAPAAMVSGGPNSLRAIDDKGQSVSGVVARRYPWRIASYLDFNMAGLYDDYGVLERYRQRADYQYVASLSPSLGINADFVGGKSDPGYGFNASALRLWGKWYVTRSHEVRSPSSLIVFASARGRDPFNATSGVQPGFYLVDAPRFDTSRWAEGPFDRSTTPETYGYVDARWSGKVVTSSFDGHAATRSIETLRDMRLWSNGATSPDWGVSPKPVSP